MPGRPVHHGHLDRAVGAGQRAARRTPVDLPAFVDRHRAGDQRRVRRVHRGRRLPTTARWWSRGRLGAPDRGRAGRAAVLDRATPTAVVPPPVRRASSRCRPTSRSCTCAGTRPRPTRAGPASGCPPRRSGRRRPGSTRRPAGPGASRGATTTRPPQHANLGQRHLSPGARRRLPGRRVGAGRAAADRRRLGVDVLGLAAVPGFRGVPVPGVLRRSSSAATTGCCAAARSAPTRRPSGPPSATGTYPIRRQIFAGFRCARDARADDGWAVAPGVPSSGLPRPAGHAVGAGPGRRRTGCCTSPTRRADMRGGGTVNADGFGAGWYPQPGRRRAGALPQRPADLVGHLVRRAGRGHPGRRRCWPRSARRPSACRSPRPRPRRSPRAAGCSATTAWSAAGRTRWPGWPPGCRSPTCSPWTPPTDSALLWALLRHRLRAGVDPAAALTRRGRARCRGRARFPAQPAAHRRHRDLGHRLGPRAVRADRRRRRAGRLRAASTTTPAGPRCPTGTSWSPARATAPHRAHPD